jgi:hypothetical protein
MDVLLLRQVKRINSRFSRNFVGYMPSPGWVAWGVGSMGGVHHWRVRAQSGERLEITPGVGRELSDLQSRLDQVYRLAWLAGDEVTSERLRRYAMELEARVIALRPAMISATASHA